MKKCPFLFMSACLAVGIILARYFDRFCPLVAALIVILIPIVWLLRGRNAFLVLFASLLTCAGYLDYRIDGLKPAPSIEEMCSDRKLAIVGTVSNLPNLKQRGKGKTVSFVMKAAAIERGSRYQRKTLPVHGEIWVYWVQPDTVPVYGDKVRLYGLLKKPKRAMNPGGFDQERFLAEKKIYAVLEVVGRRSGSILSRTPRSHPKRILEALRGNIAKRLEKIYQKTAILHFESVDPWNPG